MSADHQNAAHDPQSRLDLAADAMDEIGQLTVVLRAVISEYDEIGSVGVCTRGMLARIEELSHVARHLIGRGSDEHSQSELERVITCSRPSLEAALPL